MNSIRGDGCRVMFWYVVGRYIWIDGGAFGTHSEWGLDLRA